jgi:hypothetical protein
MTWHVARLITRIAARLVVDYFAYAACLGASAHRAAHRLSSTTSPTPCDRVPRHVKWLITGLVAPLVVDYFTSVARRVPRHVAQLVVDNSASRRLIVDYFASVARPGASARRAARHADRRAARHAARSRLRRLLRL